MTALYSDPFVYNVEKVGEEKVPGVKEAFEAAGVPRLKEAAWSSQGGSCVFRKFTMRLKCERISNFTSDFQFKIVKETMLRNLYK